MRNDDFEKLMASIKEAGNIKKGQMEPGRVFEYDVPDIKSIRKTLQVSQTEFARMIGVSPGTLRNWEQGRRKPEGPAKALLKVASNNPLAVLEALHSH